MPLPVSRELIRLIRDISKKDSAGGAEGLRLIEERQSKEIEFFFQVFTCIFSFHYQKKIIHVSRGTQACALRLDACI